MKSDFPEEMLTKLGRRKPKQLKSIKKLFPELWEKVLSSTDPSLDDKTRYDLFWFGKYTLDLCSYEKCKKPIPEVIEEVKELRFCDKKCMYESGMVIEKIKSTCMEKYGSPSCFGSKEVKEKVKRTCLERYGVENPGASETAKNKIKATCQERYGTNSPTEALEVKDKMRNTLNEKYGGNSPFSSEEVREKAKATCIERYGVENTFELDQFRNVEKMRASKLAPYDFSCLNDKDRINEMLRSPGGWKNVAPLIGYSTNTHRATYRRLREYGFYSMPRSAPEIEIKSFIESLGFDVVHNSRKIISPYEIDLYIPEKHLAIEYNGVHWHSSYRKEDDEYMSMYHLNKTKLCADQNITLLHIFENEWNENKEIWKSVIRSKLGKSENVIYARNCEFKIVESKVANDFCKDNHLQGKVNSSISYGLYYDDLLVMVATFGKPRYRNDVDLELLRMCSLINYSVVGGASKILSKMDKSFVSYGNKRWSNGNVYSKLGLEYLYDSPPSHYYSKGGKLWHRTSFMKHKLRDILDVYDPSLTAVENCYNNGYGRIWDCGSSVWIKR